MSPDSKQVEQLFQQLASLPPADREAYLDANCSDQRLRERVEVLLRCDGIDGGGLTEEHDEFPVPRRLVTGRDESGKSIVQSFDLTPHVVSFDSAPGLVFYEQYATSSAPTLRGNESDPMLKKDGHYLQPNGTLFRLLSIPPAPKEGSASPEAYSRYLAEVDQKVPDLSGTFEREEPGMHTSSTLDYVVVIRGEIILELDEGKTVQLRPGDCVIQNGTRHRWINPGEEPCLMAAVMIGGAREQKL